MSNTWQAVPTYELASQFVASLPDDVQVNMDSLGYAINHQQVDQLATELQAFIAHVISMVIDAGSERDAVNENEFLHGAIAQELQSWSNHPDVV